MCFGCNIIYRLLGAGDSGFIGMCVLFCGVLGIGGLVNAMYIVLELRVPPESIGAVLVITMSFYNALSSLAPTLAYLPQPLPLFFMLTFLILISIILVLLPPAGNFLPKLEPQDFVNEKEVLVQSFALIDSIQRDLHTSLLPLAGPAPSFIIT